MPSKMPVLNDRVNEQCQVQPRVPARYHPRCTPKRAATSRSCGSTGPRSATRSTTRPCSASRRSSTHLPEGVKAVVLHGDGDHFSAGLDLSNLRSHSIEEAVRHSSLWHRVFDKIEFGEVPVVAVLHGAVVGGGLELAAAAHVRVAERKTLLCAARRHARHLCGRRWLGAHTAADRHFAHDRHDADRACAYRPRGPGTRPLALFRRAGRGSRQGD